MRVEGFGPQNAKIVIVGEAPGAEEDKVGLPFIGVSGNELTLMLAEAGIMRAKCYLTNVIKNRPPDNDIEHCITKYKGLGQKNGWAEYFDRWVSPQAESDLQLLHQEIIAIRPNVILALGDTALWALTRRSSITKWRGSILAAQLDAGEPFKIIPTYHPAAILRQWGWRWIAVQDMRRALSESNSPAIRPRIRHYEINPSFRGVLDRLRLLRLRFPRILAVDIETINRHIACIGIAWSKHDAICIPFYTSRNYWSEEEELAIVLELQRLFCRPNMVCVFQNCLYDLQYIAQYWGFVPSHVKDIMLQHHTCFAGLPKALPFQASMYCSNYTYWKDDLKNYREAPTDDSQFFIYNCDDCTYTHEIATELPSVGAKLNVAGPSQRQNKLIFPVLKMMLRGVRVDKALRERFSISLWDQMADRQKFIDDCVGYHLNVRSPKQMQKFFYDEMGIKPIISRSTGNPTVDDDALKRIGQRELMLRPIAQAIADLRTLNVYYSTFVQAQLDPDGRMRCSYNIAGTTTFRFSSSENAFGRGMNLENIPTEDKERKDKEKRGEFVLPNIRELFVPDEGFIITDWDLDRADLHVVVWEADDKDLKEVLRKGIDMHCYAACTIWNIKGIPIEELAESHANYSDHRSRIGADKRHKAKEGVHATNYYCQPRTLAVTLGTTVKEAEQFINTWLGAHPGITNWHRRIDMALQMHRFVTNQFGYRRFFFDRIESVLPEALAWIPQSTVACVINQGLEAIDTSLPSNDVQLLMQNHDSLVIQIREDTLPLNIPVIKRRLQIHIPYLDPLTIPIGCKASGKSWGQVSKDFPGLSALLA